MNIYVMRSRRPARRGDCCEQMKWLVILCCFILVFGGCQRRQPPATVIARVGDAVLMLEDARGVIDTTGISSERQLRDYVSSWVNRELLYQEAKRQGIEKTESYQRSVENVKRSLLVQDFLQRRIYSDTGSITDEQLREYYEAHRQEFLIREDIIRLNLAAFESRGHAVAFSAALARGFSWENAAMKIRRDTTASSAGVSMKLNQPFTQQTLFPIELWKVAASLKVNEVSYPVQTDLGYFIVQPLALHQKGMPAGFDICKDEVLHRFVIARRQVQYNKLLGTLRQQYAVEVLLSPGKVNDTTQVRYDD